MNDFIDIVVAVICSSIVGAAIHSVWCHWRKGTVEGRAEK